MTEERLFSWHAALFPTGRSGMRRIRVGQWRDDADGPMEVVSGPIGRQRVHYTAPPAECLGDEVSRFLEWFQDTRSMEPVLAAGVAHLWFVTIHPFEDGNGRIARAIADMALARSEESPERFYSMSAQIRRERNAYYDMLETNSKRWPGYHRLAGLVSRMPRARHRKRSAYPRPRLGKGQLLGGPCLRYAERAPGEDPQPASGRFRREAHLVEVGDDEPLFPRHGESGHAAI